MTSTKKTHNRPTATKAKTDLRRWALEWTAPDSHVLDLYCGPDGAMYESVWRFAKSYAGCDKVYKWPDRRRRFVGDTRQLVSCLDLSPFNTFDIDAFGSPWDVAEVLARRRVVKPGERVSLVFTDGSSGKTRWGGLPAAMARLLGRGTGFPSGMTQALPTLTIATAMRCGERMGTVVDLKKATSQGGNGGSIGMVYCAVRIRG